MDRKELQIEQLDRKLKRFKDAIQVPQPEIGSLKTIKVSLGMSLQQVADKLAITKESFQEIEIREKDGTITINSLEETADDMRLIYGLGPKDGTLDDLIDRKATELALCIVCRTSNTMKLEDQENSKQRLEKAFEERKAAI